jgi:hypothetical protein
MKYKWIKIEGKSYLEHRLIMEGILRRKLSFNECVHHKNENGLDNDPTNFEIKTRGGHAKHHAKKAKMIKLKCPQCKNEFDYRESLYKWYKKNGRKLFFCSKKCSGIHSSTGEYNREYRKNIIQGIKDKLNIAQISRKYKINRGTIYYHINDIQNSSK